MLETNGARIASFLMLMFVWPGVRGARGQEHRTAVGKRRENDFTVLVVENAGSLSSTIC